jgi:hypothetical protein
MPGAGVSKVEVLKASFWVGREQMLDKLFHPSN